MKSSTTDFASSHAALSAEERNGGPQTGLVSVKRQLRLIDAIRS
jgi:hypothetical protein